MEIILPLQEGFLANNRVEIFYSKDGAKYCKFMPFNGFSKQSVNQFQSENSQEKDIKKRFKYVTAESGYAENYPSEEEDDD